MKYITGIKFSILIGLVLSVYAYAFDNQDQQGKIIPNGNINEKNATLGQNQKMEVTIFFNSKNDELHNNPAVITIISVSPANDSSANDSKRNGGKFTDRKTEKIIGRYPVSNGTIVTVTVPKDTKQLIFKYGKIIARQDIFSDVKFHQSIYVELLYKQVNDKKELVEITDYLVKIE